MSNNFRKAITQDDLKNFLSYDAKSGIFTWIKSNKYDISPGDVAGHKAKNGYVICGLLGTTYLAHRLAWLYQYGEWPKFHIDHIDGDRSNNSIANLRECTASQNGQNRNRHTKRQEKKSIYVGVSWDRKTKKWTAQINLNRKNYYLGRFDDESLAREAYLKAKAKLHDFN